MSNGKNWEKHRKTLIIKRLLSTDKFTLVMKILTDGVLNYKRFVFIH